PRGFEWAPIISWGDPVLPGAPEFDFDNQSARAQLGQAGYNCDFVALLPDRRGRGRGRGWGRRDQGVLAVNNESNNGEMMFRGVGGSDDLTPEQLEIIMAAHGMTIVEVNRRGRHGSWRYDQHGRRNRRIHARTEFAVDGPAAGHRGLRTS